MRRLPFISHSAMQGFVINSHHSRKILEDNFASIVFNKNIIRSVASLLFRCRPSAVPRLVIPVHINAIQGVTRWTFPHILQKLLEARKPFVAHSDAASPILRIFLIVGVKASRSSARIGFQRLTRSSIDAMPMRDGSPASDIHLEAPAARRASPPNDFEHLFDLGPAIAAEKPGCSPILRRHSTKRDKSPISFASNVQWGGHNTPIIVIPSKVNATFGRGWLRRVDETEAEALALL